MKLIVAGMFFFSLLMFSGCFTGEKVNPEESENIILITVDTLRYDHVGVCGNKEIATPVMDALAENGILFENAYSQTHFTTPSHISILSSLYLMEHGSYIMEKQALDPGLVTLPVILKKRGFTNAAIISMSAMQPDMVGGIDRGFDYFRYPAGRSQCTAGETMDYVEKWLKKNHERKFFLWLHIYDPHMPYVPPEPFNTAYYEGDPYSGEDTMKDAVFAGWWYTKFHAFIDWLKPIKDINYPATQYMGEISYADHELGRLMKKLDDYRLNNTWIILTSDHGENLGEHGVLFDHQGLYETTLKVPLIFSNKEQTSSDRISSLVMSVDIMPTVLDILDINHEGRMSGKSLLPLMERKADKVHDFVFAEGHVNFAASVFDGEWRYTEIYKDYDYSSEFMPRAGSFELYRYPDEETNLFAANPEIAARYKEILKLWKKGRTDNFETANPEMSEEDREMLKSLGYIQ